MCETNSTASILPTCSSNRPEEIVQNQPHAGDRHRSVQHMLREQEGRHLALKPIRRSLRSRRFFRSGRNALRVGHIRRIGWRSRKLRGCFDRIFVKRTFRKLVVLGHLEISCIYGADDARRVRAWQSFLFRKER